MPNSGKQDATPSEDVLIGCDVADGFLEEGLYETEFPAHPPMCLDARVALMRRRYYEVMVSHRMSSEAEKKSLFAGKRRYLQASVAR